MGYHGAYKIQKNEQKTLVFLLVFNSKITLKLVKGLFQWPQGFSPLFFFISLEFDGSDIAHLQGFFHNIYLERGASPLAMV